MKSLGRDLVPLFDPGIRDPGYVKRIKIRIRDPDPELTSRIIFPRAWKQFLGLKIL
jgi:hypothetical protein